jgi:hypothetical protein
MTASVGYEQVRAWVEVMRGQTHATVVRTTAWTVLCVLMAQRVTAAALARALPADQGGEWSCAAAPGTALVGRTAVGANGRQSTADPGRAHAPTPRTALRGGRARYDAPWAVGSLAGRDRRTGPYRPHRVGCHPLPVAQRPVPYDDDRAHPAVTGCVSSQRRVECGRGPGFPSARLFAHLRQADTSFSVRLRLNVWVTVAGVYAMVAEHLEAGRLVVGQRPAAVMGCGQRDQPLVPGWIAVSAAVVVPPKHKQNPGTERERRQRATARAKQRARKYGRHPTPPSATARRYAQTWVLFTTAPTVTHAVAEYAQRMAIEETFRDWHSGWGVRHVAVALPTATMVDRLIGVVCLTYSLQMSVGQRLSADPLGQRRRAQWTVTDRGSWVWCGQRLFDDPGYDWRAWLAAQWKGLIDSVSSVVKMPAPTPLVDKAA